METPHRRRVAAFLDDLASFNGPGKPTRTVDTITFILGQGDFVLVGAKGTLDGGPLVYIDLYRVAGDKLVEHWGFMEQVSNEAML